MTNKQALAEAVRRWGETAAVEDRGKKYSSTPEQRAAASAELKKLRANKIERIGIFSASIDGMTLAEARATIKKNAEDITAQHKREQELQSMAWRKRYIVGTLGFGFHIRGDGDTWEDAFKAADESAARDKERYSTAGK
jgi:hypothetical protein